MNDPADTMPSIGFIATCSRRRDILGYLTLKHDPIGVKIQSMRQHLTTAEIMPYREAGTGATPFAYQHCGIAHPKASDNFGDQRTAHLIEFRP